MVSVRKQKDKTQNKNKKMKTFLKIFSNIVDKRQYVCYNRLIKGKAKATQKNQ